MEPKLIKTGINLWFISSFFCLIFSCNQDHEINPNKEKIVYTKSSLYSTTDTGFFTMIYDLDKASNTLAFRAIQLKRKSTHPVKDAIDAFLSEHHFSVKQNRLKFNMTTTGTFTFSGAIQFKDKTEEDIFWNAMDITIARNFHNANYFIDRQGVKSL